jgi:hypothetical protein
VGGQGVVATQDAVACLKDSARRWEDAIIVLNRGTDDVTFTNFLLWLDTESAVDHARIDRNGQERYRDLT